MKLQSLKLENFRQFYGTQQILFSQSSTQQNVTVIHGFNGAGKTALLNAFIWCLYEETTADFEESERLENERALAELDVGGSLDVMVEIQYGIREDSFIIRRRRKITKEKDEVYRSDSDLSMWRIDPTGTTSPVSGDVNALQLRIDQVLPRGLYPFFFFNGERVERLASPDAYDDVEHGVKTLLDVAIFERAVMHLRVGVANELGKELRSGGDSDLSAAIEEEEKLNAARDDQQKKADVSRQHVKALDEEIEKLEIRQSQIAALTQLTQHRTDLRAQAKQCNDEDRQLLEELAKSISDDGYLAFSEPVFALTERLVAEARQRGEIPAKIKPQFVDDLLAAGKCICATELPEGSKSREALIMWRGTTGLADLEEMINHVSGSLAPLRQRREKYDQTVDRIQSRRSTVLASRSAIYEKLSIVDEKIGSQSIDEDSASLASLLAARKQEHRNESVVVAVCEMEIRKITEQYAEVRLKIGKLQAHDAKSALVKRQREAVERVADAFEGIFEIQKETVRERLDELISEIWRDAAIKDYGASIGADYRLSLTKTVGGVDQKVFGASTGEKQVLALSFVASLVKTAYEHLTDERRSTQLGIPVGGDYPLVMDSAFGSLEDVYRSKVAEWVTRLAGQVVLLVSRSQWRYEVESAVKGKVGHEYVLELHTSKQNSSENITLNGKKYPYVVSGLDPYEFTVIREVQ